MSNDTPAVRLAEVDNAERPELTDRYVERLVHSSVTYHAIEADARIAELERERDEAVGLLREANEPGVFGRFGHIGIVHPEIDALCRRVGYGFVMQAASDLWSQRTDLPGQPGGEHTVAACAAIRKDWNERADAFLAAHPAPNKESK